MQPPLPIQVFTQWTPNPNAYKFITSEFVIASGKATFSSTEEGGHIPLVVDLFSLTGVTQIHFYENVITITQDGSRDWGELCEEAEAVIVKVLPEHNIDFPRSTKKDRSHLSPEIQKVEEILDNTIRPGLQGDGGDVEVIDLDEHILTIRYEGACGTCPSALAGTLQAITGFLRDEFDPDLEVVTI